MFHYKKEILEFVQTSHSYIYFKKKKKIQVYPNHERRSVRGGPGQGLDPSGSGEENAVPTPERAADEPGAAQVSVYWSLLAWREMIQISYRTSVFNTFC